MTQVFEDLDAFVSHVGQELGTSEWATVTQEQIDLFAAATGDHQWIHVDPERAAAGPFGSTIAHGYLTLSLIPALAKQIFTVHGLAQTVNYGSNKVRYPSPVPVDSRLRATAALVHARETPAGTQATIKYLVEIEGQPKPAAIVEAISLMVTH